MRLLLAMIWLKTNSLGIKQQSLTHPNIPRNVHWIDGPLKHSRFVFHLISTKGTTVPNLFLCWQHLFFNRFWWFFLLYTKFYLWNMQTDLYGSYCFLRYKGVKMGPTPKVLNFIFSLILMAFLLWNFLPMFFKQIWPSSYGCRYKWYQRRPKWTNTQLFFIISLICMQAFPLHSLEKFLSVVFVIYLLYLFLFQRYEGSERVQYLKLFIFILKIK